MINFDEDSLICDLAETYQIYDYKGLSPSLVAVLSVGLRANSRIKLKMSGLKVGTDTTLLASMVDRLSYILWMLGDQKNSTKPKSVLDILLEKEPTSKSQSFETPDDFENTREEIINKLKKGG